jgi:hypothetical protein
VYRPQPGPIAQPKAAGDFRVETRPAPPVYRPLQTGPSATQPKLQPAPGIPLRSAQAPQQRQPVSSAIQPARYDVTALNSQRGNDSNERKWRQVEKAIDLGATYFVSEISSTYTAPVGATVLDACGRATPQGGLNYIVPIGSTIYHPTVPVDVSAALGAVGRPTSYERLWRKHPRYAVFIGQVSAVDVYGIHSKSRPPVDAQYALAAMVLDLKDTYGGGGDWALIGDLNLEANDLSARINELRVGGMAGLHIIRLGRSTHTGGKELDYMITTDANADVEQISRAGLRKGSDHSGIGINFG